MIATADPDTIACPRCGRPIRGDQEWCLSCGAAARTRLIPTPAWRAPVAVVAVVAVLAVLLLTWAFVAVTRDEDPAPASGPAAPAAPAQNVFQNQRRTEWAGSWMAGAARPRSQGASLREGSGGAGRGHRRRSRWS